jgi:hypothetical protein
MIAGWFYFSFVVLYLAHMQEEYWTGFTRNLPARLTGTFADRGFRVLNPFLLSFATAARFFSTRLNPDGSIASRIPWNCSEVYVRSQDEWRIIHSHWSYIKGEQI